MLTLKIRVKLLLLSFKIMENTVDFDVEMGLNYVLDNAEFKKHEEEILDHETTREVCDVCLKTFKNQSTTRRKKTFRETKE